MPVKPWFAPLLICLLAFVTLNVYAQAIDLPEGVTIKSDDFEFLAAEQLAKFKGKVVIAYENVTIKADEVWVNAETQDVTANGNVSVDRDGDKWEGDYAEGNLKSQNFTFNQHTTTIDDWTISGSGATRSEDGRIVVNDATITPCNKFMFLKTGRIMYNPDGRFKAYNVRYYVGPLPIFYTPVVWGDLDEEYRGFEVRTGYESDQGVIVRVAKQWRLSDNVTNKTGINVFSKRGAGIDNRTLLETDSSSSELFLWALKDRDPLSDRADPNTGEELNGRFGTEENRYRIKFKHRTDISDRLKFHAQTDVFSDNDVLYEYFRNDFRTQDQEATFADLSYFGDRFSLSLSARAQVNDFDTVIERMPELKLEMPRQQLWGNLYYQGESSASRLRMKWRDYELSSLGIADSPSDYATDRFDTLHGFYLPLQLEPFTITPRAGVRLSYFSRTSESAVTSSDLNQYFRNDITRGDITVPGGFGPSVYGEDGGGRGRTVFELGVEARTKLHALWPDISSETFDLDGLRHIIEPYANYTFITDPNVDPDNLFFFDEVDRIDEAHFVRVGVKQRFQTRRGARIHTFASIENYYDFHLDPEKDASDSGDFGTVLEVTPNDLFSVWGKVLVDTSGGEVNVAHSGITLGRPDQGHIDIAYLYRDNHNSRYNYSMLSDLTQILNLDFFPIAYDNNESLYLNFSYPLNAKTNFSAQLFFDLEDQSLARQRYQVTRDLDCWVAGLRFEKEESDLGVYLLLYLKSLPKFAADF